MKRARITPLILLCATLMSGCLQSTPLDEYGYVLSLGVDKGQVQTYNISFLLQQEGDSQQSQAGAGAMVVSAEGDSLFEAISTAHLGLPYELNFTRTNYIAFSQEIAKGELLKEFMSSSFDSIGLRRSTKLLIVVESCNEYFKGLNSPNNPSVSKRQHSLFQNYGNQGIIPMTSLSAYHETVVGRRQDAVLAVGLMDKSEPTEESGESAKGGDSSGSSGSQGQSQGQKDGPGTTGGFQRDGGLRSYSYGSALFSGEKLTAILNGYDSEILLMALGKFNEGRISYERADGGGKYSFKLSAAVAPEVELITQNAQAGGVPTASVKITLSARNELDTAGDFAQAWANGLDKEMEAYIESELDRVFLRCREAGSDAMGFGRYASTQFSSTAMWEEYDWMSRYPAMEAEFHVDITSEELMTMEHVE